MLNLLILIDGTAGSQPVIAYIAPVARETDVQATLLTTERTPERAAEVFAAAAEQLGAAEVRHVNRSEAADVALLNEAQAAPYDLVVFGPLRERWSAWMPFRPRSSLSAQLPISSLLVRGTADHIERVLLCAGGDETVIQDARLTARLARRTGASAKVLHVLSQMPLTFGVRAPEERVIDVLTQAGAPEIANMRAAVEVLQRAGVAATIDVRIGLVIDEIVAEVQAGGYDLLVIGAHRSQSLVERLLLEDVTADLLGQSPIPVLVVKGE
jgi:nucleotide-binding universal stress UspA family protein